MRRILSVDLRIGAKNPSYPGVAGSPRNIPQDSHRALSIRAVKQPIEGACAERHSPFVELRRHLYLRDGWVSGVKLDTEKGTT